MQQKKRSYRKGVIAITVLVASLALLALWGSGSEAGTAQSWAPRLRQLRESTGLFFGPVTAGAEDTDVLLGRLEDRALETEQLIQDIDKLEKQLDELRVELGGEPRTQEVPGEQREDAQHDNPQGDEPQQQEQQHAEAQQHVEPQHEEQQQPHEDAQHEDIQQEQAEASSHGDQAAAAGGEGGATDGDDDE